LPVFIEVQIVLLSAIRRHQNVPVCGVLLTRLHAGELLELPADS